MVKKTLDWMLNPDTYGPVPFITKVFAVLVILVVTFIEGMVSVATALITGEGVVWYLLLVTSTLVYCIMVFLSRPVIRSLLRLSELTQQLGHPIPIVQSSKSLTQAKRLINGRIRSAEFLIALLWVCIAILILAVVLPSNQFSELFRPFRIR